MDGGVVAALVSGGFALVGILVTAFLGRAATARARRAEERNANLALLSKVLDEQREELDWRRGELAAARAENSELRTENTELRRALEARGGTGR